VLAREAGKTLPDGLGEVREAADFCRYYAMLTRRHFADPENLTGPTGESNRLQLAGRGPFVCISPWNFPLAIFVGQVAAAFAAGNPVIAKPAEQTPLVAAHAVRLLHEAGISQDALVLVPGRGEIVGAALVSDPRTAGVAFTGSTATARAINRALAAREGPIVPFIAETGGLNAMFVDSSALAEQVVTDVIASAFNSAGQRCSALRILCLQAEIAPRVIELLQGATAELKLGDPARLDTDVGPVIDAEALAMLEAHAAKMDREAKLLCKAAMPKDAGALFFAPRAYEIASLDAIDREVFGPILHVVRFDSADLEKTVDAINAKGYGLTMGIHSRIEETIEAVRARACAGNLYVNRNMIGATVGVQPFGGEGLSGTGPKAGGPHYLFRFAVERTVTVNTAAAGGNASLIASSE
jgi:RHH-type proline utilization regulon transcriptional repressor/proline dehydrogenase/delta 1-pyrroline-5-carboxylate dehydrogenase